MKRTFLLIGAAAAALPVAGCSGILGIQVYDEPDGSVDGGSSDSSVPDTSSEGGDATIVQGVDSGADSGSRDSGGGDARVVDTGVGDTGIVLTLADAGPDAPGCTDACSKGSTRCSGSMVETCQTQSTGCTDWTATTSCGAHQTCAVSAAGAACACNASVCSGAGTACQDGQTVATCSSDVDDCVYVASTSSCASPETCSGTAPHAACSLTCTSSCVAGQTSCVSGGVAACMLGTNGCYAYGAPVACPGTRQACTGAAGSASCTCEADPVCSAAGPACESASVLATCSKDGQGCFYASSTSNCTSGTTCQSAACKCGGATPNTCGSTCTSTATDPLNCGACGAACPGAAAGETCAAGHCQPYSIAAIASVYALATDGVSIYFLSNRASPRVGSVPDGGGSFNTPFTVPGATTIATDGSQVFWLGGGTGTGVAAFYNAVSISTFATGEQAGFASGGLPDATDPVSSLLSDSPYLIYLTPSAVVFISPGNTTPGFTISPGGTPTAVAADPTVAYYAVSGSGIFREAISGTSSTPLASATNVRGLVLKAPYLYYTDAAGGTVSRVPADGSAQASALTSASSPLGLVADGSNVYFIDGGGASIMKVSAGGGTATPIATGQGATAIIQDSANIYWSTASAIVRYPK